MIKETGQSVNERLQQRCLPSVRKSVLTAKEIICEDISKHIVVKELARHSGTNECTLKKGFKSVLSVTIYRYLLDKRMNTALRLLTTTSLTEKDIAAECGYKTLPGFITTFRRYYGISPGNSR